MNKAGNLDTVQTWPSKLNQHGQYWYVDTLLRKSNYHSTRPLHNLSCLSATNSIVTIDGGWLATTGRLFTLATWAHPEENHNCRAAPIFHVGLFLTSLIETSTA